MIIIEGMDNTGKSVLQDRLCLEYGLEGVHSPGPHESDTVLSWIIESFNKDRGVLIIFDRFPLVSEAIYGPIIRGHNVFDESPLGLQLQKRMQEEVKPLIVYCKPPEEYVTKWNDRDQMAGVIENYQKLLFAYDNLMERLRINFSVVPYNYCHEDDYGKVLDKIDNHIQWWIRERFDKSLVSYKTPGPNRYYDIIKRYGGEKFI
jgi:hypothetical protein